MTRAICTTEHVVSPADLIGHLNLMHPERLQVIGTPEVAWSARHAPEKVAHHMQEIYNAKPPAIIVADGCAIDDGVRSGCEASGTPLLQTPLSSAFVIDTLRALCRASWPKPAPCTASSSTCWAWAC